MTKRRLFSTAILCLGVFAVVLLSLQVYFTLIDEEDSVRFARGEDQPITSNPDEMTRRGVGADEQWNEDDEPIHFNYGKDQHPDNEFITGDTAYRYAKDKDIPIMMWWTSFTLEDGIKKCSQGECYITENRSLQSDEGTRAFLFYGTDFDANDLPLPRKADHEWCLFHEESPKNNAILSHTDTIALFNHTATFRRHSDYPLTTQYLESVKVLENKPTHTLKQRTAEKGQASVVYVQSGCNPPSDRDAYVQELMKYINVDSFGKCLNNKQLPDEFKDSLTFNDKGFYKIVGKYKFTLVFENAICDDYLTEKIWRSLEVGSIPIYRGSPSVVDWMPNNHSVILVDDFSSPQALAAFIKKVDADDTVYFSYLEFKKKGGVTNQRLLEHMKNRPWGITDASLNFVSGFECLVCDRLHENIKRQKAGLPVIKHVANQDHFGCPKPVLFDYLPPNGTEQIERDMWPVDFDEYIPVAKSMNKVVLSGGQHFRYVKATKEVL